MSDAESEQLKLHLKKAREKLRDDFKEMFQTADVDTVFDDSVSRIRGEDRIDDFVPALAEKLTRERLRAAAESRGLLTRGVPDVLFVALNDTGRGQMGAAFMRQLGGGRVNVHSAGTQGRSAGVDPNVAEAMHEIGIDLSEEHSKPLTPEVLAAADVVVTMGRSTGIVEIPESTRHIDWRIGDPSGDAPLEEVRHIRDEIKQRVESLLAEIAPN